MIHRRDFGMRSLGTVAAAFTAWLFGAKPTAADVVETKEVASPRLSWIYRQNLHVVENAAGVVTARACGSEVILITLHRMPAKSYAHGPDGSAPVDGFVYKTIFRPFRRDKVPVEKVIKQLSYLKTCYDLTPAEHKSIDQLFHLIRPGREVDQPLPIPLRQFIVEWSGKPDEEIA
jgi:hypothetical protein